MLISPGHGSTRADEVAQFRKLRGIDAVYAVHASLMSCDRADAYGAANQFVGDDRMQRLTRANCVAGLHTRCAQWTQYLALQL